MTTKRKPEPSSSGAGETAAIVTVVLVSLLLGVRLFVLINNHAVNILYWDHWSYYEPMFDGRSWWELFRWQNGSHRQGVGFILTRAIAELTAWDTRVESFAVGGLVTLASAAALWLKRRLFGSLNVYDIAVPLAALTTAQFQTFVGAVNPAPAAFPLLLLALYCLAWTMAWNLPRHLLALALNYLLIYTGYGFFIGGITPALYAAEAWRRRNERRSVIVSLAAIAASLLSACSFFSDYDFSQLRNSAQQRAAHFWEYPLFVGLMFGRFVRPETGRITWLTYAAMLCGCLLALLAAIILLIHCRRTLGPESAERRVSLVIVILLGYALLFATNTAFGRAGMGLNVSQSSRYVTLMIPGFLAIYFHLLTTKRETLRRFGLPVFLLLLLPGHLPLRLGESHPASYYSRNKRAWKECYLRTEDYARCEMISEFKLIAAVDHLSARHIKEVKRKLDYLKQHRLNLFADSRQAGR